MKKLFFLITTVIVGIGMYSFTAQLSFFVGDHTAKNAKVNKQTTNSLFKITIDRKIKGADCTQGYLLINDSAVGYTMELPDKNNEEYISSIPKGVYDAQIRTNGTLGWRVELLDVPHRDNIQIHIGNFTRDITGCILVGRKVNLKNCIVAPSIINEVQNAFNKFTVNLILNTPNPQPVDIQVEITGI